MPNNPRLPKRYAPYGVGKFIGGSVYVHRQYEGVLPVKAFQEAKKLALGYGDSYTIIKYNFKTGSFTFIWCSDFDSANEPTMGKAVLCQRGKWAGFFTRLINPPADPWIYHHKWLMVGDDYQNFDAAASRARSERWMQLKGINKSRIGKKSVWEKEVVPKL